LIHSTSVHVAVQADSASISNVIGQLSTAGCIDNSGIASALIQKLVAAQMAISAGDNRTATNTLNALIKQLSAQSGKHISTTCTVDGTTFNPVDVLTSDAAAFIASLKANAPDPLVGSVVDSTGEGIPGATVTIFDWSDNPVASAVTDVTGFYFFATTGVLNIGSTYTAAITGLPVAYMTSPPPQTFTWSGIATTLGSFTLN
jgi:hypothetical protein